MMRSPLAEEPFVVALLQLALNLFHCIEPDPDDDEDRCATEGEVLVGVQQDERDRGQEISPRYSEPGNVSRDSTKAR